MPNFINSQVKQNVVGTQKNHLLRTQNKRLNLYKKELIHNFTLLKLCQSRPELPRSKLTWTAFEYTQQTYKADTRLRSVVGSLSGCRYVSDCKSWGREFDHGPVPYFRGIGHEIISTAIFLPSVDSRRVVVSYKRKYVHIVLVNRLVKLVQEKKCG